MNAHTLDPGAAGAPSDFVGAIAQVAEGSLIDRCAGTLKLVQWRIRSDAIAIVAIDKRTRAPQIVAACGYDPMVTDFLVSPDFMERSLALRTQLTDDESLYTWDQVDFPDTDESQRVLTGSGYRNGMSLPLRDGTGRLVGLVHTNTTRPSIESEAKAVALGTRATLASLAMAIRNAQSAALTPRETEVLRLIRDGRTNPEIADALFLSEHTVATHVENVLRKTGAENRVKAAVWALRYCT